MKMNILVLIIVIALIVIIRLTLQGSVNRHIYTCLQKKDFDGLFKILDSLPCKVTYPAFDREFIRLKAYFEMNIFKKIQKQVDFMMDNMRLDDNQKIALARQSFYYYLKYEKYAECKKVLDFVEGVKGHDDKIHAMQMMYSIEAEKESRYIDEIKEKINNTADISNKSSLEYLLGLQYFYNEDYEKAKEYLNKVIKESEDRDLKEKARTLLKKSK